MTIKVLAAGFEVITKLAIKRNAAAIAVNVVRRPAAVVVGVLAGGRPDVTEGTAIVDLGTCSTSSLWLKHIAVEDQAMVSPQ